MKLSFKLVMNSFKLAFYYILYYFIICNFYFIIIIINAERDFGQQKEGDVMPLIFLDCDWSLI